MAVDVRLIPGDLVRLDGFATHPWLEAGDIVRADWQVRSGELCLVVAAWTSSTGGEWRCVLASRGPGWVPETWLVDC
jgi:hypothetical protein